MVSQFWSTVLAVMLGIGLYDLVSMFVFNDKDDDDDCCA